MMKASKGVCARNTVLQGAWSVQDVCTGQPKRFAHIDPTRHESTQLLEVNEEDGSFLQ
jgi:hypothetical protein